MNIRMGIALLPLDTRGQAEADFECGVVERGENSWSGPCFKSLLYCHTGTALCPACKGNTVKACYPMSCGRRQLCKVVGRVRNAPGDLSYSALVADLLLVPPERM